MTAAASSPASALTDTNQHYDMDPRVFAAFLDPTMKYSSGLYTEDDDDLARAQLRKLEYIADSLQASPGKRFLDIGCGWGSLVLHLATRRGVHVVGITPAARQARYVLDRAAAAGVAELVDIRVATIEKIDLERRSFDGASFVGSIVHMPDRSMALAQVATALRPSGRLYVSESCYRNQASYDRFSSSAGAEFVRDKVFGNGDMVQPSVLLAATEEAGFSLDSARDLTSDYRRTLAAWLENLELARDELDMIAPGAADDIARYLVIGDTGFSMAARHVAFVLRKGR